MTAAPDDVREVTLVWRPGCASCRSAQEFLNTHGVDYESVNPLEPDGAERWAALGRPRVPSLVLDGHATSIYHTSQVASLLGLTPNAAGEYPRVAWDLVAIVEAWSDRLAEVDWELMTAPTPSRGRTLRNLTVNVHEPLALMEEAWEHGSFVWNTDLDDEIADGLEDADAVRGHAERRLAGWIVFLTDLGERLEHEDPQVRAGEGTLPFSIIVDAQRTHAAIHYRQLDTFLASHGAAPGALDLGAFAGLRLPAAVF